METVQQKKQSSWGHRLREENTGLREKVAALRKENARLKKDLEKAWELMAHVPGGLFLLQQETIVYANKAACGWLGYGMGELSGKRLMEIIDPEDVPSIQAYIQANAGTQIPDALRFKNRDGRSVHCAVHIKKTRYEGRNALLLNLIEIERKIEQEKALLEARKFKALQKMAGAIAREITAQSDSSLLAALTGYAKKTYHPSELSSLNLNTIIEASVVRYCSAKGIDYGKDDNSLARILFKTSLTTSSSINGCKKDLYNTFMSLIANAVESLEDEGEIYLTAEEKPGLINIYVQENGCGIQENALNKIFDPFFTTKGSEHKGLGLSMARAVIERHGGTIHVVRQAAGGTTFHVQLPLDHGPVKEEDQPKRKSINDARILLIGGQNILINLLCRFLSSKNLNIIRVDRFGESLKILKGNPFDLLLIDQNKNHDKTAWLISKVRQTNPGLPIALFNVSNSDNIEFSGNPELDLVMTRPLHLGRFYSAISRLMTEGRP